MKLVAPILVALAISCDLGGAQNAAKKGRVVCYYEQWAIYRGAGGQIAPKDLNPYLCTHLIYSFAAADAEGATIKSADENADFARNGFSDFIDLKTKYFEDLKLLLAVGGYNDGSKHFTPISATPASRTLFARNAMNFLRKHKFDGLNIDWQFPNDLTRNGDKMDYTNFPLLLKEVESVFEEDAAATGRPKLILSISVPGKTDIIEPGYDLPALVKYVEFMNVLCYDYHYAYDPYVNHHSPIYPLPDEIASDDENVVLNADATINYILSKGVAAQKLNLGIPLYGRGFTLETEDETTLGSPATGQGTEGKATRETGYKAYFELCKDLENGYTIVRHNETAMGPYAYKGNQWIGYDDEKSVFKKGEYAKKKGLGGLSFWAIDQDDFNAVCGSKKAYPLIKAAREGYTSAQGPRLPKPPSPTQPSSTPSEGSGTQRPTPPTSRVFRPTKQVIGKMPAVEVSSFTGHQTHADFPGDYDEGIAVEAASTTAKSFSESHSTPGAPSGFVQNVYVWITNNIFNHSPPHYVDTSVQSAKPSSPVRTSPPTTTPGLESLHNK